MPPKVRSFRDQLAVGKRGEALVRKALNASPSPSLSYDCVLPSGERLELKTETHPPERLCFERWSNVASGQPGGPWQADRNGIELYAHLYSSCGLLIVFRTKTLLHRIEQGGLTQRAFTSRSAQVTAWSSSGVLIPLMELLCIAESVYLLCDSGEVLPAL